jgi:hypothetical protein
MKGYRLKLLGWIFIIGIFLDMISTIIGVGFLGNKELNPIGYNFYLILTFIIMMSMILYFIKNYYKWNWLMKDLVKRNTYIYIITCLTIACYIRYLVIFSNIIMMIARYHYLYLS